ncbi:MAG: hypothetical protein IBJ00_07875 [Alphaproteobacteria bacterium]|nr:hypothetical protein [Alphaproteobacteria bacterium]
MLNKTSILLTGLMVCGCADNRPGTDWAADCKKHFSETSREYAACIEAHRAKGIRAENGATVSTTPEGSEVPYLEGKAISSDHDNTDGGA